MIRLSLRGLWIDLLQVLIHLWPFVWPLLFLLDDAAIADELCIWQFDPEIILKAFAELHVSPACRFGIKMWNNLHYEGDEIHLISFFRDTAKPKRI